MKPLTKKILESGFVDTHVARMMERWGQLEPGASDLVGKKQVTKKTLEEFAEELECLLDIENADEFRETSLDIQAKQEVWLQVDTGEQLKGFVDLMGRIILATNKHLRRIKRGSEVKIWKEPVVDGDSHLHMVTEIDPLYQGDHIIALQVTINPGI